MKTIKYFTFLLILIFHSIHAHKDKIVQKTYGNILITTFASDYVEEMNKTLIIGKYAEMLSKKLSYTDKVYLYFSEEQLKSPSIKAWLPKPSDNSENIDGVNIMFVMKNYNISGCLQVIENALLNKNKLKNFSDQQISIYSGTPSKTINEILKEKVNRPSEINDLQRSEVFSYYTQNNQYHFIDIQGAISKDLETFDNILDYKVLSRELAIVFTQENEFAVVKNGSVANRQKIDDTPRFYWPYSVHLSGENKIVIEFYWSSQEKDRMMIYYLKDGSFIQDVDKALGK